MAAQRIRGLFHVSDRTMLVQRAYNGGISQFHRDGKRHLRSTGSGKVQIQHHSRQTIGGTMCLDSSHTAQSDTF